MTNRHPEISRLLLILVLALAGCTASPASPTDARPAATTTPSSTFSIVPTRPAFVSSPPATALGAPSGGPTSTPAPAVTPTPLALAPCSLAVAGGPALPAQCGTLQVYENRAAETGRQIGLHVTVLPATGSASGASPAPDPLFFIAGGPGQGAAQTFAANAAAFAPINAQRDVVLVDQRGTGQSQPLDCPALAAALSATLTTSDTTAITAAAGDCLTQLQANVDPRLYTTSIAVDDLDTVRAALGYDRINLYGVSYGTRVALSYLVRYPDHARALILDGVLLPQTTLGFTTARDAQHVLNMIFKRCVDNRLCHLYFRDPGGDFYQVAHELQAAPVPVDLSLNGVTAHVSFTYDLFATGVWLMSANPTTAAQLPLFIHEARFRRNFVPLASAALALGAQLNSSVSAGASAAVLCSEDAPYLTAAKADASNAGTYLGNLQTDPLLALCQNWPVGFVPRDARHSIESYAPVLLLSGEYDPLTSPNNALLLTRDLPNSLDLVIPGQGHGVLHAGCLDQVAAAFLAAGTPNGLDARCINALPPVPFQTTLTRQPRAPARLAVLH